MKQNLAVFTLTVVILINITGCSIVRFAETRIGEGLKPANKTKMDLDFQLGFNETNRSLSVTLKYQPYAVYKPEITLTDFGVGLASLGLLGKVLYDNWDHDYTFTFVDDTFDWYGSETWEKAVLIGVPVDILLYWCFSYPFDRKVIRVQRQPLTAHPYRIELPDHGNIGVDHHTTIGTERIEIRNFLSELGYPSFLKDIESLKFRASTKVGGKQHRRDHTVTGDIILSLLDSPPRPLVSPPEPDPSPTPQVEVETQWGKDPLRAGEKATLKITVKNSGETVLTEFATVTVSPDNPRFDNWKLKFGNIAPGTSKTRSLGFSTDPDMFSQNVIVKLRFETTDDVVLPEIEKILQIIE